MNKEYKVRSSAVRAAKAEFGDNWNEVVEVIHRSNGTFVYDYPIRQETKAVLDSLESEIKEKKAKKKALDKAHKDEKALVTKEIPLLTHEDSSFAEKLSHEADKLANEIVTNVHPAKPRISTVTLPTKKVWDVADNMPGSKRKDVIAACVLQGIAYGTARTQYQHWYKQRNDSASSPKASIDANGKIVPPSK